MRKKMVDFCLFLMVVFCPKICLAYEVANDFVFPLDNYFVGCNKLGGTCYKPWHLGEDIDAPAKTLVKAVANGIVKHAQYHPPTYNADGSINTKNYGGMYIIEHTLLSGEKICSLCAHMDFSTFTKKVGQTVQKGELLGKVGNYSQNGGFPEHLHFGIRIGAYPANPNEYVCCDWIFSGYTSCYDVLDDWYPPSMLINSPVTPGYYPDGLHIDGSSQAIIGGFNRHNPKIGWPIDRGGGAYVHKWTGSYDPSYRVWIQDYQGDLSADHYGSDGQSALILDELSDPNFSNLVKEGFWGNYKANDGPFTYGIPFTEEVIGRYANSPYNQSGDLLQPGNTVTVQKFKRVWEYGGVLQYSGDRRTMAWKDGIPAQRIPLGEFAIWPESCAGVCPREGDQIYYIVDSNPSNDKPWPLLGVKVTATPTARWFTKPGNYNFVLHNSDGTRKSGWGLSVYINEGNHQLTGDAVYPPESFEVTQVTTNSVSLSWSAGLNSDTTDIEYNIYRDDDQDGDYDYIASTSNTSYTDTGLAPDTEYDYYLKAEINGVESAPSANLIITTQEVVVPVAEINILNYAITKEMNGDVPVSENYSYILGKVPAEIYAWAEITVSNADINNIFWEFNNAAGLRVYSEATAKIDLGNGHYYVYAPVYSTMTACDGAFGSWTAVLKNTNTQKVLTANFSMSIGDVQIAYVDEGTVTPAELQIIWAWSHCASHYIIYRDGQYLAEVSTDEEIDDRYTDTTVESGEKYIYQVAAEYRNEEGAVIARSDFKNTGEITIPEPAISPVQGFQLMQ